MELVNNVVSSFGLKHVSPQVILFGLPEDREIWNVPEMFYLTFK